MKKTAITLALFIVFLTTTTAHSKSANERITDLENRLDAVQQTYLTNNKDIASAIANSESIAQEFAALRGNVETNNHLIGSQREELLRMLSDLEHRLQAIEDRLDIFSKQIVVSLEKIAPKVAEEGALYQGALSKIEEGKYLDAIATFKTFLKKYPKSSFAPNATYWIAESLFSTRDFKNAVKEFQIFITSYPKNEKVPSAYLKQGNSFYELGLLGESKPFFEKVINEYATSPEASQAKMMIERIEQKKAEEIKNPAKEIPVDSNSSYPAETIEQQRDKYREQLESTGTDNKPNEDEF